MHKGLFGKSGKQGQHMSGHIYFVLGLTGGFILQIRPRSLSQERRPSDFWEKWKAGRAHEGTYLVFAGSCRGLHFPGQAPKPIATKMPKGLFWESGGLVQHMSGHI